MNNYCYKNYNISGWSMSYCNKDFLIANQFEMKEEVSFKMAVFILTVRIDTAILKLTS
jgi:hypothetical protein